MSSVFICVFLINLVIVILIGVSVLVGLFDGECS